ncbi:MAG: GAF domain-containing protein [Blastocatellia bacterium]|nr:GAF domain-containing protein [Blastocatellia bacterium]
MNHLHLFHPTWRSFWFGWLGTLACLLCGLVPASAQVYRFTTYNVSSGLPHNSVYCLFQDHHGFMWFGTEFGACRYDGVNYVTFGLAQGLPDSVVRTITEDQQGNLWIGTEGGVTRFDGTKWTTFTTREGLPHNETYSILCGRNGLLWLGTSNGLSRYDGKTFTNFGVEHGAPKGKIWTIAEDTNGSIWIGLRGGGLAKFDGEKFLTYGRPQGLPDETIYGLQADPQGGLWIATNSGLCFYDGAQFRTYGRAHGLTIEMTGGVVLDRLHRVWVTTFGGGLARLENEHFTVFNRTNGLPDNYLTGLVLDYEGNIWCATRSSGVFRFSNEQFSSYTATSGLTEGRVTGLQEAADRTLWCTSVNGGLTTLDPQGKVHKFGPAEGMTDEALWSLRIDSRGRVWVGGYNHVYCLENGKVQRTLTREQIGATERITSIFEDRQGNIWFGSYPTTSNGVIRFDGTQFTRFSTEQGLGNNSVSGYAYDHQGNLVLCTENGVARFDGERFQVISEQQGLPTRRVNCAYKDETSVMWIGTANGLCRMDGTATRTFTTEDGLISNSIRTIIKYNGMLWIGTARGISVYDGQHFRNYTTRDGLISEDICFGMSLKRQDGSLWFGTNEGVVRYQTVPEISLPVPPRLWMHTIRVQERTVDLVPGATGVRLPSGALQYDENSLTFEYAALSFRDEAQVRYRYLLDGFDSSWSAPTASRSARFTNLPPGDYRFLVKAASTSDLWSEPLATVLTIRPPFWQTTWFRLLAILATLGTGGSLYAWHIRTLKAKQQEKLARYKEIQEQRLASLRELLESIRIINSQLDLTTVLQNIVEESAHLVGSKPSGIGIVEGQQVAFRRSWVEGDWKDLSLTFHMGHGVAGTVAATGQPVIVNDTQQSELIARPDLTKKYGMDRLLGIPIVTRTGKVVGVITVFRGADEPEFTQADCRVVESLASQAAVAMENAGLYGELNEKNAELEEKNLELEEKNLVISESMKELEKLYRNEREVTQRLQELNHMKTNFLVVTSHEMRTPLTVLKGYTESLVEEFLGPLTTLQKQSLNTCHRMIDRMVLSFENILEMLKINEGRTFLNLAAMDPCQLIRTIIDDFGPFLEKRRQHIVFEGPAGISLIADQNKLHLALTNVIQNAIKFTHDDGEIRVTVRKLEETIEIQVKDPGIGIEAKEIDKIFDPFYTHHDPSTHKSGQFEFATRGTGLGLAIAHSYVLAHNGKIWAESEGQGKGSCFRMVLPLVPVKMEPSAPPVGNAKGTE